MGKRTPGESLDALLTRRGIAPADAVRPPLAAWLTDADHDLERFADLGLAVLPLLARYNVCPLSEAAGTVFRWLLADAPADRAGLEEALALGVSIERHFHAAFADFFLAEGGEGERLIRRRLRRRLGHADGAQVESVLERIRNRRGHLLDHFRGRYQPSLFGPITFDPDRVRGYLVAVVRVESLHVPDREHRTVQGKFQDLGWPERAADAVDYFRLGQLLRTFWGEANGFSKEQGYEGLVSLALGVLADHPDLRRRCRRYLEERLPSWEEAKARLQERISRLLAREEDLRQRHRLAADGPSRRPLRAELEGVERRLERLDRRLGEHPAELRPRPHEVEKILAGCVRRKASRLRHERLGVEVGLLTDRVHAGARSLLGVPGAERSEGACRLLGEVPAHLGRRPRSPRGRHVSAEERSRRGVEARLWLAEGKEILGRVRGELRALQAGVVLGESQAALLHWLQDVEDAYELTVLSRTGILGAPGRRHGERLGRLLRVKG